MTTRRPRYPSPQAIRKRAKELRWSMTPAEAALWEQLKTRQLHGLKFRRQHPIGRFIVDFYCHEHQMVVEVDGDIHDEQLAYDEARSRWLAERGFRIIRFTNDEITADLERVLRQIAENCGGTDSTDTSP